MPQTPHSRAWFIAEQLRLIWNARGAVDLVELEHAHADVKPTMKVLDRAIRALGR